MAHWKWKETKQQPSLLPSSVVPGCSLVSFLFLWAILCLSQISDKSVPRELSKGVSDATYEENERQPKLQIRTLVISLLFLSDGRHAVTVILPLAPDEGDGEGDVGGADGRLDDHEGAGRQGVAPELGQGCQRVLHAGGELEHVEKWGILIPYPEVEWVFSPRASCPRGP